MGQVISLPLSFISVLSYLEGYSHYASVVDQPVERSLLREKEGGCGDDRGE